MNHIIHHPLMALFVTVGSFLFARWLQGTAGGHSLLNPVVLAIMMVSAFLLFFGISYEDYVLDVRAIDDLLGPATVALALPLYRQFETIRKSAIAIGAAVLVSCLTAAGVGYFLAQQMGASEVMQLSILTKSVTTPIAIGISEQTGADPSLAVFFIFTTGIIGTLIAMFVFKLFRIRSDEAIGLSLGITCHALGVARALSYSQKAGAFAALGLSLMGIVSGALLPLLVMWLLR